MKTLLLFFALLLAYWFIWGRGRRGSAAAEPPSAARSPEKMVVCAHCRLHVPEGDALTAAGRHYCCDEHRRLGSP